MNNSKTIKTFANIRGERASTDGCRWWLGGADEDETSRTVNALQPVGTLFPIDSNDALCVHRTRAIFIDGLRKSTPSVKPTNDAERDCFRRTWDAAVAFNATHHPWRAGVPVFDGKLGVIGVADAIFKGDQGNDVTYCHLSANFKYGGAINALVRLLWAGVPFSADEDPYGFYTQKDLACALLALVYRHESDWWREHAKDMPF